MKNNALIIAVCFGFILISAAIYFKPMPNRYSFEKFDDITSSSFREFGYIVKDSASGKIYKWTTQLLGSEGHQNITTNVVVTDPVRTPYQSVKETKK